MNNKEKFEAYHAENPQVWKMFKYFTSKVRNKGFKNYSAEAIFNQIRWYTDIETNDPQFKINNNHKPFYARKYMKEKNCEGFFRIRKSKADEL